MDKETKTKAQALVDKYNGLVKAKNKGNWVQLQGNIIIHSGDDCYNFFEINGDVDLKEFETITSIEIKL